MAKIKLTKKEADKIMQVPGKLRGSLIKMLYNYVKEKGGEVKVKEIEEKLKNLGYPFSFKKVSSFAWYSYPLFWLVLCIVLEVFNLEDSEVFSIGYELPTRSVLTNSLVRVLFSDEKIIKLGPNHWRKFCNLGELKYEDVNLKKKKMKLIFKDIPKFDGFERLDFIASDFLMGFVTRFFELVTKSKKVNMERTENFLAEGLNYEYYITW